MGIVKELLRELLIFLHLDLTKNLKYDRLTRSIMKNVLKAHDNCIDVGCHKGEMLRTMLKYAPNGQHFAFEPIPHLYNELETKFGNKVKVFSCALSDKEGETTFHYVKNAPAYSGLKQRRYDINNPEIEELDVQVKKLDDIIPQGLKIDFIKIDVEGGEFPVLQGGANLLKANKPIILFECGMGASDYYGTDPVKLYQFLTAETGLDVYTLASFERKGQPMSESQFKHYYDSNQEYYFIAAPRVS